jgi:hypothetical protein
MSRRSIYFGSFASAAYFTDLFGVPAAAYSLRKLSPNAVYSGAAIRVRRSSDNTEQDINFTSSAVNAPLDTNALLSFVGAGNGFITTWYNQGSGASDSVQTTAANQPQIVLSGSVINVNGKPAIWARVSTSTQLQTSSLTQTTQSTFGVFEILTTLTASSITLPYLATSSEPIYHGVAQNGSTSSPEQNFGTPSYYLNGALLSPVNRDILWDNFVVNAQKIATTIGGGTANTTRTIQYPNLSLKSNSYVQETIIYSSNKSSDQTAIETNINDYYNVF